MRSRILKALFDPEYRVLKAMELAHILRRKGPLGRFVGGLIWVKYVTGAGCHISPYTPIGKNLRLPHPVGIVIGADCSIGESVTIYQNVTLGRRRWNVPGGPVLANNVIVYAGAVVIGPIHIGEGSIIGANCVVAHDVPPNSVVRLSTVGNRDQF